MDDDYNNEDIVRSIVKIITTSKPDNIINPTSTVTSLVATTADITARATRSQANINETDSSLLIIFCLSVLIVLTLACICSIYFCCQKYFFNRQSDATETYNGAYFDPEPTTINKTTNQNSPSPPQMPTVQNAVDRSSSAQSSQNQTQQQIKPSSLGGILKFPELTRKSYLAQQPIQQYQSNKINAKQAKRISSSGMRRQISTQAPILMDKVSITADMFAPNLSSSKSKKEIVLFKAASFTE